MNLTQENTGELTATLKIEITKEDYQESADNELKTHQKKASMPGFRPGKVPLGMIKKMYEKAVIAEQVNNLLSENINNYIVDNKLNLLGNPLPNAEKTPPPDFENNNDFTFYFDIGWTPEIDLELSDKIEVDYYKIRVDQKMEDDYINNLRTRFGSHINPDVIEDKDVVKGEMVELDSEGTQKEGGLRHQSILATDLIKLTTVQEKFMGAKNGDSIVFNPLKAMENAVETANMLGITKEDTEKLEADYEFTINEITRHEPAELNVDLYKQAFGEDIDTDEKFKMKVKEVIERSLDPESDRLLMNHVILKLMEITDIQLPDDFLKRWLLESNEGKLKEDELESQYGNYTRSLRWQLIESKIVKDNDIEVKESEIRDVIRNYFGSQMMVDPENEEAVKGLEGIVNKMMENKEETGRIHDQLFDNKLKNLFKSTLKLSEKTVSIDEFTKLAEEIKNK